MQSKQVGKMIKLRASGQFYFPYLCLDATKIHCSLVLISSSWATSLLYFFFTPRPWQNSSPWNSAALLLRWLGSWVNCTYYMCLKRFLMNFPAPRICWNPLLHQQSHLLLCLQLFSTISLLQDEGMVACTLWLRTHTTPTHQVLTMRPEVS